MQKAENYIDKVINESSLSRIIQHIEGDRDFAVISAFRIADDEGNLISKEENIKKHIELENDLKENHFGFIEQESGYTYKNKITGQVIRAEEMSFFVPKMDYKTAMELAIKYGQESILIKDKEHGFALVYAKNGVDEDGNRYYKGQVGLTFKSTKDKNGKITFEPEVLKKAYSALIHANKTQKGKQYAFVVESISEGRIPSRASAMMGRNYVTWKFIA